MKPTSANGRWLVPLLVLLRLAMPVTSQAQFDYTIENNNVTITKYNGAGGGVTIPDTIGGLPVTIIGSSTFFERDDVTSVALGPWITSIRSGAFAGCSGLTAISVSGGNPYYSSPDGVLFDRDRTVLLQYPAGRSGSYALPGTVGGIGPGAFADCNRLTSIGVGDAVTGLEGAFATCSSLTAITVSGGNPYYISLDGVLFDRDRITLLRYPPGKTGSYNIPSTVGSIAPRAFADCAGLTGITIGNGVGGIDVGTFATCPNLTMINVGGGNPYYSSLEGVLFDRQRDTLLYCPAGRVGNYTVPNTVSSIGPGAFADCVGLTSIAFGDGVGSVGGGAFANCRSLTAFNVSVGNPYYSSPEGVLHDRSQRTLIQFPAGRAGSFRIPGTVTSIGPAAFADCRGLVNVTMGPGVATIGSLAFANCTELAGVYFEGDAPALGVNVFSGADNATVYYRAGTSGLSLTYGGRPTVLWDPQISTGGSGLRVVAGQFGFTINGASGLVLVVEASPDLTDPRWSPVATITLEGGPVFFADPEGTSYPGRFYRLRSP